MQESLLALPVPLYSTVAHAHGLAVRCPGVSTALTIGGLRKIRETRRSLSEDADVPAPARGLREKRDLRWRETGCGRCARGGDVILNLGFLLEDMQ